MKLYQYTVYKQDGTIERWEPCKKKEWRGAGGLYEVMGWRTIELIPKDYYAEGWNKRGTLFGDEEGRFNQDNHRNPHTKVLTDPDGNEWDCVGDLIMEEVAK